MSEIEPFAEFLRKTREAHPEEYADAIRAGAALSERQPSEVAAEFEGMKKYILDHYTGVHPVGSLLGPSGQVIDCVPFDQLPTVRAARAAGIAVTRQHSPPVLPEWQQSQASSKQEPPGWEATKREGGPSHTLRCPDDSFPVMRITLDHLLRLGGLENFFRKSPGYLPPGDTSSPPPAAPGHP